MGWEEAYRWMGKRRAVLKNSLAVLRARFKFFILFYFFTCNI